MHRTLGIMGFRLNRMWLPILRTVVFMFCMWQIEVCLIFRGVGWQTDILFVKLPNWFVVTFYSVLALAMFLWPELVKRE